jgi:hypothetical protein
MKKLRKLTLTILTLVFAIFSAFASEAYLGTGVDCETPPAMFGSTSCIDQYGALKICKHTFGVEHSCEFYWIETEESVTSNN